ncbi:MULTISPECIES: hypothetical protein [unclassified Enterococcus]|uniref:hypothetical protein n=1 Tax=unclassified Enterococcus TaxID=2608891 RepID=UPI00155736FF|nr:MULTISPECIES: hypothetical protein [unclassified Enterococcus]MBS7576078.1 hypothetical protein [Enterococcus sp. MMGLQ5-2]MBS7583311.1 hypothetical protein [Enterococcus sp. MMGLQ5-1]NPD11171.1 hypothetical protein [Enterococcus sp. MMGLQ5-1]NPD35914.1 hypothetical protein [Enterococcus sp. MMGLQ5-2]
MNNKGFSTKQFDNYHYEQLNKIYQNMHKQIDTTNPKINALLQAKLITTSLTEAEKIDIHAECWEVCRKIKALSEIIQNN